MSICRGDRVELLVQDETSVFYFFSLFDLDFDMKIRGEGIFLLTLDEENPVECVGVFGTDPAGKNLTAPAAEALMEGTGRIPAQRQLPAKGVSVLLTVAPAQPFRPSVIVFPFHATGPMSLHRNFSDRQIIKLWRTSSQRSAPQAAYQIF